MNESLELAPGTELSTLEHHASDFADVFDKSSPLRQETRERLSEVIQSSIIPSLFAASRPEAPARQIPRREIAHIGQNDIEDFTELLLDSNDAAIDACVQFWRAKGVPMETIYLELLTGAARRIGTLWGNDDCNFCEVSIATWRIQQMMYEQRPAFFAEAVSTLPPGFSVLLAPLAPEQHSLGVMMAAEFFRRAGWEVSSELPSDNHELIDAVSAEHLDLVGISVSGDVVMRTLPDCIRNLRRASKNPHLIIMLGGWMFADQKGRAEAMGADFAVANAREALDRAYLFVTRNKRIKSSVAGPAFHNAPEE